MLKNPSPKKREFIRYEKLREIASILFAIIRYLKISSIKTAAMMPKIVKEKISVFICPRGFLYEEIISIIMISTNNAPSAAGIPQKNDASCFIL
jgi:hypothetical protein